MHKERLLKLADLLEADAAKSDGIKFSLYDWAVMTKGEVLSCGTTACAAGLAAISGIFKDEGLDYRLGPVWADGREIEITLDGKCEPGEGFNGSFMSVVRFFELTPTEGEWLFIPQSYAERERKAAAGELAVASRIRDFVAGKAQP